MAVPRDDIRDGRTEISRADDGRSHNDVHIRKARYVSKRPHLRFQPIELWSGDTLDFYQFRR